eukprot:10434-Heterococcus_DN1.PRE.1
MSSSIGVCCSTTASVLQNCLNSSALKLQCAVCGACEVHKVYMMSMRCTYDTRYSYMGTRRA